MDIDGKKRSSRRLGFTVLEIMIVVAVLSILIAYVLSGLRQQLHISTLQQYLQNLDMQGSRIMQELTFHLRPAILPVETDAPDAMSEKAAVFELLDSDTAGFRWTGGEGRAWRDALGDGVDRIAFVVPVDAQGDLDVMDDLNHMEVGQRRGDRFSLDADFTFNSADGFRISPSSVPASSLVRVSPALLANDATGGAATLAGWPGALYSTGAVPGTSAFTVIRYVPAREGGSLVRIVESDIGVDLNGDGLLNSAFNIGKLQLVHVGGTHAVQPPTAGLPVVTNNVPNQTIDLSADVVLREEIPADRQPIFKLVKYSSSGINSDGVVSPTTGDGSLALHIKVNLFDPSGRQNLRARAPNQQFDMLNRQFETVLTLRNMTR